MSEPGRPVLASSARWRRAAAHAVLAWACTAHATDLERGALLYATPPAPGLLACMDCHSEDPLTTNFGNIFVGRNAPALIQRAVNGNTGGMGYFRTYYDDAALADIAAWLGNAPPRVDFGEQPPGQASDLRSVTVRAGSKAAVPNLRLEVGGDFRLVSTDCPATLPPRGGCQVQLAFVPTVAGERQGWLSIAHDALPTPARVTLVGRGRDRPLAQASLWPPQLDFGSVPVAPGQGPRDDASVRALVLANASAERLRLSAVELGAPLEAVGGSCRPGLVLGPGQRCELALRWRAAAPGHLSAQVLLRHDGEGGASVLTVTGHGVAQPLAQPAADAALLDFGALAVGRRSAPQVLTVSAAGGTVLDLAGLQVGPAGFAASGGSCRSGLRLQPGERCTVQVEHQPWRAGAASGAVTVQFAGGVGALRVPLQGVGLADAVPALRLQPTRVDWRAEVGQLVSARVWLLNDGSAPATLQAWTIDGVDAPDLALAQVPPDATGADLSCSPGTRVEPGARCVLALAARALQPGLRTARLQLRHSGGTLALPLQGHVGPGPWIETDAASVTLTPGGSAWTVEVHNPSSTAVRWADWQAVGSGADAFILAGGCTQQPVLAPGGRCSIEIRPAATAAAPVLASLPLVDRDAGVLALLSLALGSGPAAAAAPGAPGWLALDPDPVATVGADTGLQRLRYTHPGPGALTLGPASIDGSHGRDFSLDPAAPGDGRCRAGLVLAQGASCELGLSFHPSAPGLRTARLRVQVGEGWIVWPLQARARARAQAQVRVEPGEVLLVADAPGSRPTQRVQLLNEGAAALWLAAARAAPHVPATGGEPGSGCPADGVLLLPGQRCAFDLAWDGSPAASAGEAWHWSAFDGSAAASLPVAVVDGPDTRRNVGAGAGLTGLAPWGDVLLAAVLLAWAGWRQRVRR